MKWIRWSEKDYLRGLRCCCEVHWSGIDCDKKTRPLNQGKVANELRRRLMGTFVGRGIKPYA